jgi:hypothetical protein
MNNEDQEPYDYIFKYDSFRNILNNKKLNFIVNSKENEINSPIYYCIGIKSTNLSLQSKFINCIQGINFSSQKEKDDILFLAYFNFDQELKERDLYLFINYIDDFDIPDNFDQDEYHILKDLTNQFLINFSDIFILLIDEDEQKNEKYNQKLINEIINSTNKNECFIIHAVSGQTIKKIRQLLNNKDEFKKKGTYKESNLEYINKNNENIRHFLFQKEKDKCKENENISNVLEQKIKKEKIRNENFCEKYYDFIIIHISEKFNKIINKGNETPKKKNN